MTQEPALHVTAPAPLMAVQSTPRAFAHPPQLSMFDSVSTHSNASSRPGIGHLVRFKCSQATSRRTRRAPPEAATVFAVAAKNRHIRKGGTNCKRESRTAVTVAGLVAGRHAVGVPRAAPSRRSRAWGRSLTCWAGGT